MSRDQGLLSLLRLIDAAGGEIQTRIRLQKEAFLLSLNFETVFDPSDFEYHHFGPYSRSLSNLLKSAVSAGFVTEECEAAKDDSFTKYHYIITEAGRNIIRSLGAFDEPVKNLVSKYQRNNWRALELAATALFLQRSEGVEMDVAIGKALQLKPKTASFEAEARAILV